MPRTRRSVPPYFTAAASYNPPIQVDSAVYTTGSLDFAHALFAPLHYTPGYAYPLIVWLHGRGSDERQLQRIMPMVSMQNFLAAAPRGVRLAEESPAEREYCGWPQADRDAEQAEQRIFDCIELTRRKFNVHTQRIFLAGFDGGGTMALRLALSQPNHFAGVLSLCGAFPTGGTPLGNLAAARRLGVFLATGRGSQQYPAAQVCDDLRLLHTAGLSVTLRQYPCGHELLPQMLADINRWIMEQINPPPTPAVESDAEWLHEAD